MMIDSQINGWWIVESRRLLGILELTKEQKQNGIAFHDDTIFD